MPYFSKDKDFFYHLMYKIKFSMIFSGEFKPFLKQVYLSFSVKI